MLQYSLYIIPAQIVFDRGPGVCEGGIHKHLEMCRGNLFTSGDPLIDQKAVEEATSAKDVDGPPLRVSPFPFRRAASPSRCGPKGPRRKSTNVRRSLNQYSSIVLSPFSLIVLMEVGYYASDLCGETEMSGLEYMAGWRVTTGITSHNWLASHNITTRAVTRSRAVKT